MPTETGELLTETEDGCLRPATADW